MDVDAYALLGVPADATQDQLKEAHRRLVRRLHPDLAAPQERAAATRRVQDINVAYGLVRDPRRRAAYDRARRERLVATGARPGGPATPATGGRAAREATGGRAAREATGGRAAREATGGRAAGGSSADMDRLLQQASRWAGRWWGRNRGPLRRAAARRAMRVVPGVRRAGAELLGRVLWLAAVGLYGAAGYAAALSLHRILDVDGYAAPLTGLIAGGLVGSQRGWQLRLRLAGFTTEAVAARVALVLGLLALGIAVWVDVRLGQPPGS